MIKGIESSASKLSRNSEQAHLLHNARQSTETDRENNKRRRVKGNLGNGLIMSVANNMAAQLCELWRGFCLLHFYKKITSKNKEELNYVTLFVAVARKHRVRDFQDVKRIFGISWHQLSDIVFEINRATSRTKRPAWSRTHGRNWRISGRNFQFVSTWGVGEGNWVLMLTDRTIHTGHRNISIRNRGGFWRLTGIGRRARRSVKCLRDLGWNHITEALRDGRNSRFLVDILISIRTVTTWQVRRGLYLASNKITLRKLNAVGGRTYLGTGKLP